MNFYGITTTNGNKHDQRSNEFASYLEDDIKVNSKLTVNLGVRWEYDGYPSDTTGLFTNGWASQAALVNTGSFFLGNQASTACGNGTAFGPGCTSNQIGTLAGMVVQSNYNPNIVQCGAPLAPSACGLTAPAGIFPGYPGGATGVYFNTNKTLVHGAPINNFGPRIGVAWQPLGEKFVVRAGYGIYYDAVYANLLANNNAGNPPYNAFVNGAFPVNSLDIPVAAGCARAESWGGNRARFSVVSGDPVNGATLILEQCGGTGLGTTSIFEGIGSPLIQQYNSRRPVRGRVTTGSWMSGMSGRTGLICTTGRTPSISPTLRPTLPMGRTGDIQDARNDSLAPARRAHRIRSCGTMLPIRTPPRRSRRIRHSALLLPGTYSVEFPISALTQRAFRTRPRKAIRCITACNSNFGTSSPTVCCFRLPTPGAS